MKNILVTGGCGFIASNFLNYMVKKYFQYNFINLDALYYCASKTNILKSIRQKKNYSFIKRKGLRENKAQIRGNVIGFANKVFLAEFLLKNKNV